MTLWDPLCLFPQRRLNLVGAHQGYPIKKLCGGAELRTGNALFSLFSMKARINVGNFSHQEPLSEKVTHRTREDSGHGMRKNLAVGVGRRSALIMVNGWQGLDSACVGVGRKVKNSVFYSDF